LEERSAVQIRKDLVKDIAFFPMIGSQATELQDLKITILEGIVLAISSY
jgi:hypothetical protein